MLSILVAIVDYVTGAELKISIFYLLPISLMAWYVNRRMGVILAIVSSALEVMTDLMVGHPYSHSIIVYWNGAVQASFFTIIVLILSALRSEYDNTLKINAELQEALDQLRVNKDKLERSTQDLARSNAELEKFAFVVAHDLKGPLITAGGYMQRLQHRYKDKFDKEANGLIGHALDGVTRMERLIHALLSYARAGVKPKNLKPTNFNDLVERAVADLQMEIEKSAAKVSHDQLPTLLADEIQIAQLFQNLIGNGIKFHREDFPYVHISAEQQEKEWVFCVHDNGIGIDQEDISRIFDIYERLHASQEYQGTGIGLAICKKIVENHGGRIWVESELGKGSAFFFALPHSPLQSSSGYPL
jgi:light-regulated signal transduction histidine kinase (bacteriophytochrome)